MSTSNPTVIEAPVASPPASKPRGIIFSAPMVLAILAGTKTQTRRLCDVKNLRVRLPYVVTSDQGCPSPRKAEPGVYLASMNDHGAVSAVIGKNGVHSLGLRPGEFDFVCPFAKGTTRLFKSEWAPSGGTWRIEPHGEGANELWVRETFRYATGAAGDLNVAVQYAADSLILALTLTPEERAVLRDDQALGAYRSPLLMPRWASRIRLRVTDVRLQHLRALETMPDLGREDVLAEGFVETIEPFENGTRKVYGLAGEPPLSSTPWSAYARGWNTLHKDRPYDSNPWVWAVSFQPVIARGARE